MGGGNRYGLPLYCNQRTIQAMSNSTNTKLATKIQGMMECHTDLAQLMISYFWIQSDICREPKPTSIHTRVNNVRRKVFNNVYQQQLQSWLFETLAHTCKVTLNDHERKKTNAAYECSDTLIGEEEEGSRLGVVQSRSVVSSCLPCLQFHPAAVAQTQLVGR